jgi:hypothetical protein
VPEGVAHQYYNGGNAPATFIFGVAPLYLPKPAETKVEALQDAHRDSQPVESARAGGSA